MSFGRLGAVGRGFGHLGGPLGGVAYSPVKALGADLLAYWDVSRSDLITQSGGLVSSFKDIVAGYNLTAATTAQPSYSATGFNGAACLVFDGVANCLRMIQPVALPTGSIGSEIWVLCEQDALASDGGVIRVAACYGGSGGALQRQVGRNYAHSQNRSHVQAGNGTSGLNSIGNILLSTRHLLRGVFASSASTLYTDGTTDTSVTSALATGSNLFSIGSTANNTASSFWSGKIVAVLVTKPLGAPEAAGLQNWALNRISNPLFTFDSFEADVPNSPGATITNWVKTLPNAAYVTTELARKGSQSVKFDFNFSDWATQTHDQIQQTADTEVFGSLESDYWYGFSTYIPSWSPDDPSNGDIIWQLHGSATGPAVGGPPPIALYVYGNTASYKANNSATISYPSGGDPDQEVLYSWDITGDVGVWIDTVVQAKFSYAAGYIRIWRKRSTDAAWTQVVNYSGSTIYHCDAQTDTLGPYFWVGPYKWDWGNKTTVVSERIMYVDEIRFGKNYANLSSVAPGQ